MSVRIEVSMTTPTRLPPIDSTRALSNRVRSRLWSVIANTVIRAIITAEPDIRAPTIRQPAASPNRVTDSAFQRVAVRNAQRRFDAFDGRQSVSIRRSVVDS